MVSQAALGALVSRLRRERDLTQGELALRAGIRIPTLYRVERGVGNPTLGTVAKIARALDIPRPEMVAVIEGDEGVTACLTGRALYGLYGATFAHRHPPWDALHGYERRLWASLAGDVLEHLPSGEAAG